MAKRKRRFDVVKRPNLSYLGNASWLIKNENAKEVAELEAMRILALGEQNYMDEIEGYAVGRN